jgi:hypothetical protein
VSEIDDGGLAFPSEYYAEQGMTLRDYFAAAALQGILANPTEVSSSTVIKASYEYADAMLTARKEEA